MTVRGLLRSLIFAALGFFTTLIVAAVWFQIPATARQQVVTRQLASVKLRVSRSHTQGIEVCAIQILRLPADAPRDVDEERRALLKLSESLPAPRWVDWRARVLPAFRPDDKSLESWSGVQTWGFHAAGWPMRCLRSGLHMSSMDAVPTTWAQLAFRRYRLPISPIWLGLVANTGLFALLWWIGVVGFVVVRSRLRQGRDRCPRCAYNLSGQVTQGCSECGWKRGGPAVD